MAVKEEILINVTPQETRVAVVENGVLQEVHIERAMARGIVGNIYKGKIVRVLPGMQAAFVDIGIGKNGFLHASDIVRSDPAFNIEENKPVPPIQELVNDGQTLCVQVLKDSIGNKGARLTTELSIPSRYLVYMPTAKHIGISQKIEDEEERERLRECVEKLLEEQKLGKGFIIRTVAEAVSEQDLLDDMQFLNKLWLSIEQDSRSAKPASLVHADIPLAMRTMRDLVHDDVEKIRIDSRETHEKAVSFAKDFIPEVINKIEYYPGERPLFDLYAVEEELKNALDKKVLLKSGGHFIIDQTEAMTTIDVNTGAYVGKRNQEETLFKTNLEAAQSIAHQIRLRNIGGIIIVDFIDMENSKHKKQVLAALEDALAKDRVKTNITDMSPLGLVELTRKRTRESLERTLCESCPVCDGKGSIKTVQTICYQIFREILREDRSFKAQSYSLIASQGVIDMLLDEEATSLADLQEFINKPINLQVDPHYNQEVYEIILS